MSIKCLVFDCDGVLLDSVDVKTNAFGKLAEPWGEEAKDRMTLYHRLHGGVSRYLKFEWFFREYLHREITPSEKEEWADKFRQYSLEAVRSCPLIPGALEVLQTWHKKIPLYVCTGAPAEEVSMILQERNLSQFFSAIYGSPPIKSKLLDFIVHQDAKILPEEVVMIGDASTDREAAEAVNTQFYGVGPDLRGGNFPWSMTLEPLNNWIRENL